MTNTLYEAFVTGISLDLIKTIIGLKSLCRLVKLYKSRYIYKSNTLNIFQHIIFPNAVAYENSKTMMTWQKFCMKNHIMVTITPRIYMTLKKKMIQHLSIRKCTLDFFQYPIMTLYQTSNLFFLPTLWKIRKLWGSSQRLLPEELIMRVVV